MGTKLGGGRGRGVGGRGEGVGGGGGAKAYGGLPSSHRPEVSWLPNVPATCECISGTDLLRSGNFTCCHTDIEVADQTFYLTQSPYTDTRPTSPSADPITPGAWSVNF